MDFNIKDETSKLNVVMLGIATDMGKKPVLQKCYDPKSIENILNGTYPKEKDCIQELNLLKNIFEKYGVKVIQPKNIVGVNQIFTRDISFVIEDKLIIPNIIDDRMQEINGMNDFLFSVDKKNIINVPDNIFIEGGDVILHNDYIFIGYSDDYDFKKYKVARTNKKGVDYIQELFPHKKIISFQLNKSDDDPYKNALHLDCCFQPIGNDMAILCPDGFKKDKDVRFVFDFFGKENIITINRNQMYQMYSNVFSISNDLIISEENFSSLNHELSKRGFKVETVKYSEISKMSGLLRCSTMPLKREG